MGEHLGSAEYTARYVAPSGRALPVSEMERAVVKLAGEPSYTSESTLVGAGGTYVFRYAAVAPGETTLTLIYHRSFEPDVPPLKTFTAPIVVR